MISIVDFMLWLCFLVVLVKCVVVGVKVVGVFMFLLK